MTTDTKPRGPRRTPSRSTDSALVALALAMSGLAGCTTFSDKPTDADHEDVRRRDSGTPSDAAPSDASAPDSSTQSDASAQPDTSTQPDTGTRADASTPPDASAPDSGASRGCALPNYPDETCTGVPAGTTLRRVPTDVTSGPGWTWVAGDGYVRVTADNAVVDGIDVPGCISVEAVGVTVQNSRAQCITTGQSTRARDPGMPRLTIQDTEVACPDMDGTTAIGDRNINVYRVNVHGCENGFDMDSDATIEDSYIHDLHQSPVAHTDGLQSAVGSNLIINHNRFYGDTPGACGVPSGHTNDCGGTSAININNNSSGPSSSNTTVSNNLIAGGAYTLYCPIPQTVNFRVLDNHWSRIFYPNGGAFGTSSDCRATMAGVSEWSGNVWDDTGATINP